MKLLVIAALLCLAGSGHAIKCYSCVSSSLAKMATLPEDFLESLGSNMPDCSELDLENPQDKFKQECPPFHSGCMKLSDPDNPKNAIRSCFVLAQDTCEGPLCYCDTDLCNGAALSWPSVVVLLASLAAALGAAR